MLTDTKLTESPAHDSPRTLMLIVHAHIFSFVEGWNELNVGTENFSFNDHAFNFDYLLHLSGINYLIHPADIPQIIQMIQKGGSELVEFNFRFVNRSGEIRSLNGMARFVAKV